uniref:CSON010797 protein n=1 Tax=Culicoides sonorensis TaxID=179676 RepID=A0A336KI58_CULSO
MQINFWGQRL